MNKFLIPFPHYREAGDLLNLKIKTTVWVTDQMLKERKMEEWCIERMGEPGFPNWQFSTNYIRAMDPSTTGDITELLMADGIYIFDEEDRVAFKLTFNL